MRISRSRNQLLVEPPASATGDIAFNLIVFFLVCTSVQPDTGRKQTLPRSEEVEQEKEIKNIEIQVSRNPATVTLNGDPIRTTELAPRLRGLLQNKTRDEERVVVVKSKPETPYHHWIYVTGQIEDAGGIITIQTEEEREVRIPD
jgi:biopolymer transport protein ExbD